MVLSNNHVLDWGTSGLLETLRTLHELHLPTAGAGRTKVQAEAAVRAGPSGNVLIFGLAAADAGVPEEWAAGAGRPGVAFADDDFGPRDVEALRLRILAVKRPGVDVAILSVHWGSNWDHHVPKRHRKFAEAAIRTAGVDLIHGHSSHHVKTVSMVDGKLVLWGCGDLLSDYEGIDPGHQRYDEKAFAPGLGAIFFPTLDVATGRLWALRVVPLRNRKLSLQAVAPCSADVEWLRRTLSTDGVIFEQIRLRLPEDSDMQTASRREVGAVDFANSSPHLLSFLEHDT